MSGERARLVDEIFTAALDEEDRESYVAGRCGDDGELAEEVRALLAAADTMGDFLGEPAAERLRADAPSLQDLATGTVVRNYTIEQVLGTGGAGRVYLATQSHPRRQVALKFLRGSLASPQAVRRFQDEAEILARMKHPGVAHVYEAETFEMDGVHVPFFALEYVEDARSVVDYANHHRLDAAARMALLANVCDAVQHGHQKGVLHLDLKPDNVLVDKSGRSKIIDFGIADAGGADDVRNRGVLGTLPYMSPEQCSPDERGVDARSDVYSLGVLLYELLTGAMPVDVERGEITDALRRIRTEPHRPASDHDRSLRGDVDAILDTALAKSRGDRYDSAAALAADIRRHLRHEPLSCRPHTALYVLGRFARRRRVAFGSIVAVVVVSIAAAVISSWFAVESDRRRREADMTAYIADIAAAISALDNADVGGARRRLESVPPEMRKWEWRHLWSRIDSSLWSHGWEERLVLRCEVSHDGEHVAVISTSGGFRCHLSVMRVDDDAFLYELELRNDSSPYGLAVSEDRNAIALAYIDGGIEIRDLTTGEELRRLPNATPRVNDVIFHPTRETIVTAGFDGVIRERDLKSGNVIRTLTDHTDRVINLAIRSDGSQLASAGREGVVRLWDLDREVQLHVLDVGASVEDVDYSADGMRIAAGARDHSIRIWDSTTGAPIALRREHTGNIRALAFADDAGLLVSGSWDRTLRLWDANSGEPRGRLLGHTSRVMGLGVVGQRIVSTGQRGTVRRWNAAANDDVFSIRDHTDRVTCLAFSTDSMLLASGSQNGRTVVTDLGSSGRGAIFDLGRGWVRAVQFGDDDATVAIAAFSNTIHHYSIAEPERKPTTVRTEPQANYSRGYHEDWLHGDQFGGLVFQDPKHPANNREIPAHADAIFGIGHSVDADVAATITTAGHVVSWNSADWSRRAERTFTEHRTFSVAVNAEGTLVAVGDESGAIHLLEPDTLETIEVLIGHEERTHALAFSPDGTRLASAGHDATLRLWDVETRRQVAVLVRHTDPVLCVAWSPDGTRLATGDGEWEVPGVVAVWHAPPAE